jgi:hypothetical protein
MRPTLPENYSPYRRRRRPEFSGPCRNRTSHYRPGTNFGHDFLGQHRPGLLAAQRAMLAGPVSRPTG